MTETVIARCANVLFFLVIKKTTRVYLFLKKKWPPRRANYTRQNHRSESSRKVFDWSEISGRKVVITVKKKKIENESKTISKFWRRILTSRSFRFFLILEFTLIPQIHLPYDKLYYQFNNGKTTGFLKVTRFRCIRVPTRLWSVSAFNDRSADEFSYGFFFFEKESTSYRLFVFMSSWIFVVVAGVTSVVRIQHFRFSTKRKTFIGLTMTCAFFPRPRGTFLISFRFSRVAFFPNEFRN